MGARLRALRELLAREPPPTFPSRALRAPPPPPPAAPRQNPLVDSHGRAHTYLRVSLTERCNLRCTYCMPADGVSLSPSASLLTADETVALAGHFVGLGVTKLRLTGGEPTVRRDLVPLLERLAQLRERGLRTLGMTSNGLALSPSRLAALWDAGLDALNLSLDTLRPTTFEAISRRPAAQWGAAWGAVEGALAQGWGTVPGRPLKVNAVVQRGVNDGEAPALVESLTRRWPVHLRLIEFMPFGGNAWGDGSRVVPSVELRVRLAAALPGWRPVAGGGAPGAAAAGAVGAPEFAGGDDWAGTVGFISTVSDAFCGSCTRLRLTADGALRACLHGEHEVSLRDALRAAGGARALAEGDARAQDAVTRAIAHAVVMKHAALGGRPLGERGEGARGMVKIGG
jgi:cyclic pyranopterin phosphate synthase